MRVDIEVLQQLVKDGYLTARPHPTADLLIWNYTSKTQYERYWTPETLLCRGLITHTDGTVVARSFSKFFNYEEITEPLPLEPFTVTEKMDGSLGILFTLDSKPQIATRGSFTSEQAIRANRILQEQYSDFRFQPEYSYLFEIVYPENRITVNYGTQEDLILLAVIVTETGTELDIHSDLLKDTWPFPLVRRFDGISDITELRKVEQENAEGFVIRFESGMRVKMKFADYVRLHHIITHVNARIIWDLLRTDQLLEPILERVPDEFYTWVKRTREDLLQQFTTIETQCRVVVDLVEHLPTRKEQAMIVTKEKYPGIVFAMLDKKNYPEMIWKLLYPEAARPFAVDEEV